MNINDIFLKAGLADHAPTKGAMIIKPYGYALWESIQSFLNAEFKKTGHQNVYFPALIPQNFFQKESAHVEGFAKECSIVTHDKLKNHQGSIIVDPDSLLEEPLVLRPTSETIIWNTYKNWIQSYRDLPLLYNQWANVFRSEMRPRLFFRTSEFLWQEGHTAHETSEEAQKEVVQMLNIYEKLCTELLALSPLVGKKSFNETFAGADYTLTLESLTYEKKALQLGTSHFLGQSFSKAFDVRFSNREGGMSYPYCTSWGVSTRLIGALCATHMDEKGLKLPPSIAPYQVVLIPVFKGDSSPVLENLLKIKDILLKKNIRVLLDDDNHKSPGWKFSEYDLKGVPLKVILGPKDLEKKQLEISPRVGAKYFLSQEDFLTRVESILDEIQKERTEDAKSFREANTFFSEDYKDFQEKIEQGGFVVAPWDNTLESALKIQQETKATIRVIKEESTAYKDLITGKQSKYLVYFAKSY
jgi:prolyl-tRNA synthetase